jgi:hypothetical protein
MQGRLWLSLVEVHCSSCCCSPLLIPCGTTDGSASSASEADYTTQAQKYSLDRAQRVPTAQHLQAWSLPHRWWPPQSCPLDTRLLKAAVQLRVWLVVTCFGGRRGGRRRGRGEAVVPADFVAVPSEDHTTEQLTSRTWRRGGGVRR